MGEAMMVTVIPSNRDDDPVAGPDNRGADCALVTAPREFHDVVGTASDDFRCSALHESRASSSSRTLRSRSRDA